MDYAVDQKMPGNLSVQLLMDKANMLKKYLKTTQSDLVICVNIGPDMATFKLYNIKWEDSLKLHITISNLGDIEQLYQFWVQLNYLLREYCPI